MSATRRALFLGGDMGRQRPRRTRGGDDEGIPNPVQRAERTPYRVQLDAVTPDLDLAVAAALVAELAVTAQGDPVARAVEPHARQGPGLDEAAVGLLLVPDVPERVALPTYSSPSTPYGTSAPASSRGRAIRPGKGRPMGRAPSTGRVVEYVVVNVVFSVGP
ncbi:hypothetical protein SMICM304S_05844 [Streptomyces microflavus]